MVPRLPGAPETTERDRIVCHVDADCFYAACERLRDPVLRGEPVVVGMGYEPGQGRGAVATASYEARAYGVESAMGIEEALERLPRVADVGDENGDAGYYRPVDMEFYEEVAEEVRAILHEHADVVREVSIDEAYLDVSDSTGWEVVDGFARHLKGRIADEVGITVSVGIAPTMSAAKVASDREKPDGLVVVRPGDVRDFLASLPVEEVHGVGPVTARKLRDLDIETAGDLAAADQGLLGSRFGERGRELGRRARGVDDREVTPRGDPKSFSRESAFADAERETGPKRERIQTLSEAVAARIQRTDALYRTVGIKAVTPPYDVNTRERSLPSPTDDPDVIEREALALFEEFDDEPVRKVGVRVSNLSFPAGEQARLGGEWDEAGDEDRVPVDEESGRIRDETVDRERDDDMIRDDDTADEKSATDEPAAEALPSPPVGQTQLSDFVGWKRSATK